MGTHLAALSGKPSHSSQWEAISQPSVGSHLTALSGKPSRSPQWEAISQLSVYLGVRSCLPLAGHPCLLPFILSASCLSALNAGRCSPPSLFFMKNGQAASMLPRHPECLLAAPSHLVPRRRMQTEGSNLTHLLKQQQHASLSKLQGLVLSNTCGSLSTVGYCSCLLL